MEMHAVPQNIMQVEFQLFGNLTIREFSIIAAGGILAFVTYSMGFPAVIQWPLVIMFAGGGILIAKYKINDRNLEGYLFSFFNAMMAPQKMVWKKSEKKMELLTDREQKITSISSTRYIKYSAPIIDGNLVFDNSDGTEDESAIELKKLFDEIYKNNKIGSFLQEPNIEQTKQKESNSRHASIGKEIEEPLAKTASEILSKKNPTYQNYDNSDTDYHYSDKIKNLGVTADTILSDDDIALEEKLKKQEEYLLNKYKKEHPQEKKMEDTRKKVSHQDVFKSGSSKIPVKKNNTVTKSNIISGFVKTKDEKLLEGAVIVIKNSENGKTVRSMITNALGHFSHTSSLNNGKYTINIYKDGYNFEPISIELKGEIIQPININE